MKSKKKHKSKAAIKPRLVARSKKERILPITIGKKKEAFRDLYVRLLDVSWVNLIILIIILYFVTNLLFGFFYLETGGIENARPGSFMDAFFFSVQTLATIGFGKMAPVGMAANMLVTFEALLSFCFLALVTGLVFSKFSRPTSRVIFSNVAVICPYNGVPHLMLRLANERGNSIVDASANLSLLRIETSKEGQKMRRFHDLKTVRHHVPILQLTWTVMHPIDEHSPLYNISPEKLRKDEVEIIISLTGIDETLSQTIHARYSYLAEEIICNATFEDIIRRTKENKVEINYNLFHKTKPID